MQFEIYVPDILWLKGGDGKGGDYNRYFASLGTDGQKGMIGQKIFNYAVFMEKSDDGEVIKAAVYAGQKSFKNTAPEDVKTEVFDAKADSIPAIKQWIEQQVNDFFAK